MRAESRPIPYTPSGLLVARRVALLVIGAALAMSAVAADAQARTAGATVRVKVLVVSDTTGVDAAIVRAERFGAQTNVRGEAELLVSPGTHTFVATKLDWPTGRSRTD